MWEVDDHRLKQEGAGVGSPTGLSTGEGSDLLLRLQWLLLLWLLWLLELLWLMLLWLLKLLLFFHIIINFSHR